MKKALVTGGTGLLGNNIVRELVGNSYEVLAAVRKSSDRKPFTDLDLQVVEVDFQDEQSITESLSGVDTVIHSAGFIWFGWSKLQESRAVNVGITSRIAKICLEKNIRFVHISSLDALPVGNKGEVVSESALDQPDQWNQKVPCNYVVSKTEADLAVKELFLQGLSGCIVHPGLMFGPYDWKPSSGEMIAAISKMGMWFSCPTGGASVTDVRDVAQAAIQAAKNSATSSKHYILGGHNISYRDLCDRIATKCGVARARGRTGPVAYGVAALIGGFSSLMGNESMINTGMIRMARLWHYYNSERAMAELGYQIRDLDVILDDAIEWLSTHRVIQTRGSKRRP